MAGNLDHGSLPAFIIALAPAVGDFILYAVLTQPAVVIPSIHLVSRAPATCYLDAAVKGLDAYLPKATIWRECSSGKLVVILRCARFELREARLEVQHLARFG